MQEVTLHQMLDAREMRAALQKSLIDTYKTPLVCFTMNIAGPIKTSRLIERAFFEGVELLQSRLPNESILHRETDVSVTGCQAMFCVSMDAKKLKAICTDIEDSCPLGRLFDMDVLDTTGRKLSRENLRGCIVCGASGRECAASRLHTVPQLQASTCKIITEHFFPIDCRQFADLATDSLLEEVYTTPKPGLVDRSNNGSHTDMDISLFVKSAHSLTPYFHRCVEIGYETRHLSQDKAFEQLRTAGIEAEKTMFETTNGVNTHKGAIFSLGVLCGALGRLWKARSHIPTLDNLLSVCSQLVSKAVREDLSIIDTSTAGGRFYHKYGLLGIRGEVASGFSSVKDIGLPVFRKALDKGYSRNEAGAITLVHLISLVEDTNLYNRADKAGADFAKNSAKEMLRNCDFPKISQIERLDDLFISRNLSPGGCADLLAVTYFLAQLQ